MNLAENISVFEKYGSFSFGEAWWRRKSKHKRKDHMWDNKSIPDLFKKVAADLFYVILFLLCFWTILIYG